jgi:hypothetical protein
MLMKAAIHINRIAAIASKMGVRAAGAESIHKSCLNLYIGTMI